MAEQQAAEQAKPGSSSGVAMGCWSNVDAATGNRN
jgi:hypothetical protein